MEGMISDHAGHGHMSGIEVLCIGTYQLKGSASTEFYLSDRFNLAWGSFPFDIKGLPVRNLGVC